MKPPLHRVLSDEGFRLFFPLAALTIILGVYPDLLFNIVEPSFERIMDPFMRGPLNG